MGAQSKYIYIYLNGKQITSAKLNDNNWKGYANVNMNYGPGRYSVIV